MKVNLLPAGVAVTALALAACSSGSTGGSTSAPFLPQAKSIPVTQALTDETQPTGKVEFAITIAREQQKTRQRAAYVSAGTESMTIAIAGGQKQAFNLTSASQGCTIEKSGDVTCTETMSAPAGKQTITITTYDGAGGKGDVLATATTSATIVAKQVKQISPTLKGVIARAVVEIDGSDKAFVSQGVATRFPVTVNAYDAKNDLIIAPGDYHAPVTLRDSDSSGATVLSSDTVTQPGSKITLAYTGASISSATVTAYVNGKAERDPATLSVTAAKITANPASLKFDTPATQTFDISEKGYSGAYKLTGCPGIAAANPLAPRGSSAKVTVTPVDGGKCAFTITDTHGNTAQVSISVSGGGVIINGKGAQSPAGGN
jgi:hypothetical protein